MKAAIPMLAKMPARTVLTITTIGDPNKVTASIMPALYGSAYGTKFKVFKPKKIKMEIGACSAFWPDAHRKPKSKWTGIWNLEVSSFVKAKDIIQKDPAHKVALKKMPAATVAQVLYVGSYASEGPTIMKLHEFITAQKLKIVGAHEEVYLTRPGPKAKTLIRYEVRRARV